MRTTAFRLTRYDRWVREEVRAQPPGKGRDALADAVVRPGRVENEIMQEGLRIQKLTLIELHVSLLARDHDGRRLDSQPRGGAVQHGAKLFRRHGA